MFEMLGQVSSTGKKVISQTLPPRGAKFKEILRDCGQCKGCRYRRRMEWALRLKHEAMFHDSSVFVTLTYDDDHLPADGSLVKAHVQGFLQKLRDTQRGEPIRYYAIGEYGGELKRPHYHLIIFGASLRDRVHHYTDYPKSQFNERFRQLFGEAGIKHFRSPTLEKCWEYGYSEFGESSSATMHYVTKHHVDKVTGEKALEHYEGREPEFSLMSKRPGIGTTWIERYWREVYPHGFIVGKGGEKFAPPKFYDRWLEHSLPDLYRSVKHEREQHINWDKLLDKRREAIAANRAAQMSGLILGKGKFHHGQGVTAQGLSRQFQVGC